MQTNETYGITVEDLEKAASVRLFEKAAAAEGINLAELSESQVEDLYAAYQQHSSEDNTPMNDELIDLFEKQAAYEGVDLEGLSDDELAYVFNNFVENISDDSDDYGYEDDYGYDDDYEEEEAYEKLAEAEILGRHMARAYMDELQKEAEYGPRMLEDKGAMNSFGGKLKELVTGHKASEGRAAKRIKSEAGVSAAARKQLADELREIASDSSSREGLSAAAKRTKDLLKKQKDIVRAEKLKGYGKRGLTGLGLAGAAYGAKKMMEKEAANEAIYGLAVDRAEEFLKEGSVESYDGSTIDNLAIEVLNLNGYEID